MSDPTADDARFGLFQAAMDERRFSDALAHLRTLRDFPGGEFQLLAHEADLLGKLGDHEGEIAILERLIEKEPLMASLRASLANAQITIGDNAAAVATLRKATEIDPAYGKPWWLLSDLKSFRFDEEDLGTMRNLLAKASSAADRISFNFALGRAHEDRSEWEPAFKD
jgi:predicted Zn-dependent protease